MSCIRGVDENRVRYKPVSEYFIYYRGASDSRKPRFHTPAAHNLIGSRPQGRTHVVRQAAPECEYFILLVCQSFTQLK